MCHVKETLMTLAHNACQARHSKRDYLGDYRAILRLFLRMRFRRLFELPHKVVIVLAGTQAAHCGNSTPEPFWARGRQRAWLHLHPFFRSFGCSSPNWEVGMQHVLPCTHESSTWGGHVRFMR